MEEPAVELQMADVQRIEDLVGRDALSSVCRSFFDLFGLPIRVFSSEGVLLADVHQTRSLCRYLNGLPNGHSACAATVADARKLVPEGAEVLLPCFTGAVYRVVPIHYDGRRLGRFVVGPYMPAETKELPSSLLQVDAGLDEAQLREAFAEMPRVRRETAERITQHLSGVLDLILFSGHKAYLTSNMHLLSVRSNFRELADKNQRLQQAYDRLKELDRLKSNFLATISHELRTPLTSIIGYSEMLATGMAGTLLPEQRQFVDTIRHKGDQLLELITSLLDMSKFEHGHLQLKREIVDVGRLLDDVAKTAAPLAKKKQISMTVSVAPDLLPISGDPARLRQVLQNLTDNAIKFTPAKGKVDLSAAVVEVRPSLGSDDGEGLVLMMAEQRAVEVRITDTGIGIAPDQHRKVFDAFYQVDGSATREHGGTGLGLSIVKRLVEAHGGTVRVESTLGVGATFIVTLPEGEL